MTEMKKYRVEFQQPYEDDPSTVYHVPIEDANGDWVPIGIAKALYDALKLLHRKEGERIREFGVTLNDEWIPNPTDEQIADAALYLAENGDD